MLNLDLRSLRPLDRRPAMLRLESWAVMQTDQSMSNRPDRQGGVDSGSDAF